MSERRAAQAFPPGDYIKEFIEGRGWTQKELARKLGCSQAYVSDLICGRRGVSQKMSHRLAKVFETSALLWLSLEHEYQAWRTRD